MEFNKHTGGVVRANSAVFINNEISVKLEWLKIESLSDIYRCDFIWNDDYQIPTSTPLSFIKLNNYSNFGQPEISGCNFINNAISNTNVLRIGRGIESLNSSFTVDEVCTTTNYPCDEFIGCSFENLEYGICATGTKPVSLPLIINKAEFVNNREGIYIAAIDNAIITSNTFMLNVSTDAKGLYLNECNAYHVEDNYFTSPMNTTRNFGIIVNYSGPYVNEIYRNTFENINTGINAQDENRAYDGSGLVLRCNSFDNTIYDINVLPTNKPQGTFFGIGNSQGAPTVPPNSPDPLDMAGNDFYYNNSFSFDYDDLNNELRHFNYYYPSQANISYTKPEDYTSFTVTREKITYNNPWEFEVGCPSKLNIGGGSTLKTELTSINQKIDSVNSVIQSLVDGGNTDELQDDVDNSVPPETLIVYNQLLDESPYLSDTVISTSIEKENVLPNAMIRDIMVANTHSAKSDELITKLDERDNPMPDYMKAQVLQGRDSLSLKEEHEAALFKFCLQKHTVFNELIRQYSGDTVNPDVSMDSLVSLLTTDNNLYSKYQLAFTHLESNEYQLGSDVLSDIPNTFTLSDKENSDYQSLVDYYNILLQAAQADSTAIWPDSAQLIQIWELYNTGSGIATSYARNLLQEYDNLFYIAPVAYPDFEKSAGAEETINLLVNSDKPEFLKAMPNPAKDYIIFEYQLEMPGNAELRLLDIEGNLIETIIVNKMQGQEVVNTSNWIPGVYIATLNTRTKKLQNIKFAIVN